MASFGYNGLIQRCVMGVTYTRGRSYTHIFKKSLYRIVTWALIMKMPPDLTDEKSTLVQVMVLCLTMLCTAQLGSPVLKASERVWKTPFQLGYKSSMITDQHTAGGSVSQLTQLAKLSPWLTLSTEDITTSFWHYNKWFGFLSNQIKGLY